MPRNLTRALARTGGFSAPSSPAPALVLRLVARRHVDLHRVSSALCRPAP